MSGYAPLGRLVGLAMIIAGLGTATLATPETAFAATADSPTAIGVSSGGTSYIGFASGGKLIRLGANGKAKPSINLDSDEAVDGIFVTAGDDIWVDYESGFSLLNPNGHLIAHYDHDPVRSCTSKAPASRYGGITAANNRIYIANRCDDSVSVYARNGDLLATVDLPGDDYPRGITYGGPQAGRPATLYVAVPDRGEVLSYRASSLRSSSKPSDVFKLSKPGGGRKPEPAGLAVDKWGQLTVSDIANNAIYLYDTNHNFELYRTLGHPPRASREAGRLNGASAIAQHDQDGGDMSGDLWIADTNNTRVQHWNTSGWTFWTKNVRAGSGGGNGGGDDGGGNNGGGNNGGGDNGGGDNGGGDNGGSTGDGPTNRTLPSISPTSATVGTVLTCNKGTWTEGEGPGGSNTYAFRWKRDGTEISGAISTQYTVLDADDGKAIACVVRATNGDGTTVATSPSITIGDGGGSGGTGPTNSVAPTVTGAGTIGSVLTCNNGTWSPSTGVTFTYQWKRGGVAITTNGTAQTYTIVQADNGAVLTCAVKGTYQGADRTVTSSNSVTVGSGNTGTGPVNTVPPSITGTFQPGQVITCNNGQWTGTGITYSNLWRRNGAALSTLSTYTLTADDAGATFTCTVTATFTSGAGSTVLTSAPVTIPAAPVTLPTNTALPTVSPAGTANIGQNLTCAPGTWTGSPTFEYSWKRNGQTIALPTPGATFTNTYTVVASDAGASLTCVVFAFNTAGNASATSAAVTVQDANPPSNTGVGTAAPSLWVSNTQVSSVSVGSALTCKKGTWSGTNISYQVAWKRNGNTITDATSDVYLVLSDDLGSQLSCVVTGKNTAGQSVATSPAANVTSAAGSPGPVDLPMISGTVALGQTLTCSDGTWSPAATTYIKLWQRGGEIIGSGSTHQLVQADMSASIRCIVVAGNGSGLGAAASQAVNGAACTGATGVVINPDGTADGADLTTSLQVQLGIKAPAGTTKIRISNNSDMSGYVEKDPSGTCSYSWTLPLSIPGLALPATVYVQFDSGGVVGSTIYQDSIVVNQGSSFSRLW